MKEKRKSEIIDGLSTATDNKIVSEAKERIKNRNWLMYSQKIAIVVLMTLKSNNITQKELAKKMGVSPQYVNKLVKGKEKLNIETIAKLEEALAISLIEIQMPKMSNKPKGKVVKVDFSRDISKYRYDTYQMVK
jgi:transcriptional regulator with XRE-family HTH domain